MITLRDICDFFVHLFKINDLLKTNKDLKEEVEEIKKENEELKAESERLRLESKKPKIILKKIRLFNNIMYIEEGNEEDYFCPTCYEDNRDAIRLHVHGGSLEGYKLTCRKCNFCLVSPP